MIRRSLALPATCALLALAASCGFAESDAQSPGSSDYEAVSFKNCGVDVTIDEEPQRVVLLDSGGVTQLDAIGVLDRVVAKAGEYPAEYFDDEVNASLADVPELDSEQTSVGGVDISLESIIDAEPDLVIGYETETVTRDGLEKADIPLYSLPAYCDKQDPPSLEAVTDEVSLFGKIFNKTDAAEDANADLQARIDDATSSEALPSGTTGAALFVAGDGSAVYAYASQQLVHVQMEELGVENVFADLSGFVPEIGVESLVKADPEKMILLYTDTSLSPTEVADLVRNLPGADALTAVRNDDLYPLLLNYSQPPSPLTVTGVEKLRELLTS